MKGLNLLALSAGILLAGLVSAALFWPVAYSATAGSTLPGDASCDASVDSIDAALVLQVEAGLLQFIPCADNADPSGDGIVDAVDAVLILQFVAGLLGNLDGQLPPSSDLFFEANAIWSADFQPDTYLIAVSILNLAGDWYACDVTVLVISEPREPKPVFVGDVAPQEYTEPHIWVPLTEEQMQALMDVPPSEYLSALPRYQVELTWHWCHR